MARMAFSRSIAGICLWGVVALALTPESTNAKPMTDPGVTLHGLPGSFRTLSAWPLVAGIQRHQFAAGFFPRTHITYPEETHSDLTGHYTLSYRSSGVSYGKDDASSLASPLSVSLHVLARRYRVNGEFGGGRTTAIGDTTVGLHYLIWRGSSGAASMAVPLTLFARNGGGPEFKAISPSVYGLYSHSFPSLGPIVHRVDADMGFEWDNANALLDAVDLEITRRNRLAQGVFRETSMFLSLAYNLRLGRIQPFLEIALWKDVDGRAIDSQGEKVNLPFGSDPKLVTAGMKAELWDRLGAFVAVDTGFLTSAFPGEERGLPPWQVWIGFEWGAGMRRSAVDSVDSYKPGSVVGQVLDLQTEQPVTALVQLDRRAHVAADQTGEGSYDFPGVRAGLYQLRAAAAGYEPFEEEILIEEEQSVKLDIHLDPIASEKAGPDAGIDVAQNADSSDEVQDETPQSDADLEEPDLEVEFEPEANEPVQPESIEEEQVEAAPPSKESLSVRIEFPHGSADLSAEMRAQAEIVAEVLAAYPNLLVRIQGRTTRRGEMAQGSVLSLRRALAIADALAGQGIDRKRLVPTAFKESPAPPTAKPAESESGYVEFVPFEAAIPPASP